MEYTLKTSSFDLEYVGAWKNGIYMPCSGSYAITGIMIKLINTFEKWPMDIAMVEKEAAVKIREWWQQLTQNGELHALDAGYLMMTYQAVIKVKGPGRTKTVCIHFCSGVLLMFEIKKKQKMQMSLLRTLAADKVSGFISKREDIKKLEVPNDVMDDLNEAYDDCWRVQYNTADSTEEPKAIII